jgi:hypothetical protein
MDESISQPVAAAPPVIWVPGEHGDAPLTGWAVARRRGMELLIVFVGVYAAFLLNRYDTYRRDEGRRRQILEALEREISDNVHSFEGDIASVEPDLSAFDQALAAGKMPRLGIVMTNPSYDASDDATLLAAGGLELLDVPSIELLRKINEMQRALVATIHNAFELSLAELTNRNPDDFYDLETKKLKERYQWVPYIEHNEIDQAKALVAAEKQLLAHLRALRHPGPAEPTPRASPRS